jgi:hypothetical protein
MIVLAFILAGCTSGGRMLMTPDSSKPRSVFVEPVADYDELTNNLEIAIGRRGYDSVKNEGAASYRLRSSVIWTYSKISASVRLVDASGHVVYFGECNNPGVGTLLNSRQAVDACLNSALENLQ